MRRLLLVTAAATPLLLATGMAASAKPHVGGAGFRHGGFHARGIGMRPLGMRPAFPAYRQHVRAGWHGGGWGWRRDGHYPYRGYRGGYPYWGSDLAAAATLGAIATYPAYPAYPVYPAYEVVPAAEGGQCSTPVKICTLYEPAPLGIGCSCRVPDGHARGVVVGP